MRETIKIPDGLNKKESALYRSLMRSKEENFEKRWHYNLVTDLIGIKKTNSTNGEVKVTFEYVSRKAFINKKSSLSVVTEELEKIKKSLDLKIEGMEKEQESLTAKSNKVEVALAALKDIIAND